MERRGRVHVVTVIGVLAVASSVLYLVSDVIEVVQGRFSTGQLWLTLVAEASVPVFVIGLWLVQRPRIGRVGAVSSIAYAYTFAFFTGTVVYALVGGARDFVPLLTCGRSSRSPESVWSGGSENIPPTNQPPPLTTAGVLRSASS